jgi:uncharacterized protein (DUF2236 family)
MSGMILGACLEADSRIRMFEQRVRIQKRLKMDREQWERHEQEFEEMKARVAAKAAKDNS